VNRARLSAQGRQNALSGRSGEIKSVRHDRVEVGDDVLVRFGEELVPAPAAMLEAVGG